MIGGVSNDLQWSRIQLHLRAAAPTLAARIRTIIGKSSRRGPQPLLFFPFVHGLYCELDLF